MRRSYALSPSVTSRVPHGSLDVDARLGFRRTRPRSTLQVLPAQRFVDGTPYPRPAKAGRQEPRKLLFPGAILAHLPLTMLCPPGADVGESSPRHGEATIPEGDRSYSSPTSPRFYNQPRPSSVRISSWMNVANRRLIWAFSAASVTSRGFILPDSKASRRPL